MSEKTLKPCPFCGNQPKTEADEDYEYINIQPCFTLSGAEDYLHQDGHNLKHPDIYVCSGHRNTEWQLVREYLKNLLPNPTQQNRENL